MKAQILYRIYIELGTFTSERESFTAENSTKHLTLLFDIFLDDTVLEDYHINSEMPNN